MWLAIAVGLIGALLTACSIQPNPTPMIHPISTLFPPAVSTSLSAHETDGYVDLEELYRSAPAGTASQYEWWLWQNDYEGRSVKGKGTLKTVSIHPQAGKLFLIVASLGEDGSKEDGTHEVALLIEDAQTARIGETEGSFLLNEETWIYLGDTYEFEGRVFGYSRFDTELASAGYSDLIIVEGKLRELKRQVPPDDGASGDSGTEKSPEPTSTQTLVPTDITPESPTVAPESPSAPTGNTTIISVGQHGSGANDSSTSPAISADGRYIAFSSLASNLVPDDTNRKSDIFVHDTITGMTTRVSVASDGTQGNGTCNNPAISADGRYVAFWSESDNLVLGDTNGSSDIFMHEIGTGNTTRISVASDGAQANGASYNSVSLSGDGKVVVFMSSANNLVPGDTNYEQDVFIHSTDTGITTRVSIASDGTQGNGQSSIWGPAISRDGRYIAFMSGADNLVPGDTNNIGDIFVHDREAKTTSRVSVSSDGSQSNNGSGSPSISGDGRYVAFDSGATNLVPGDTNNMRDIFVHDRETGTTSRVSVSSDGTQSNASSPVSSISGDGRIIGFSSEADNLVLGDTNAWMDIFVHDLATGITTRVSVASDGTQGNYPSYVVSLSGDGKYVTFTSWADNLVLGDANNSLDIFLRERIDGN